MHTFRTIITMTTIILPVSRDERPASFTQQYRDTIGSTKLTLIVHTRDEGLANDYFRRVASTAGLVPIQDKEHDSVPWWQIPFVTALGAITFIAAGLVAGAILDEWGLIDYVGGHDYMPYVMSLSFTGWVLVTAAIWLSLFQRTRKSSI
jgi:hypothetical protein